jgi:hypothetical protein
LTPLDRRELATVRDDEVCAVPGVGPGVALTYRATVERLQHIMPCAIARSGKQEFMGRYYRFHDRRLVRTK